MKKFIATLIIFSFISFFSFPSVSNANNYFGGRLTGTFFCTCSLNLLLFIDDYKSGSLKKFIYGPGSNLLVGSPYGLYQLGSYGGSTQCKIWVPCHSGACCVPILTAPLIGGGSPGFGTSS
jgi:hypothetical protein